MNFVIKHRKRELVEKRFYKLGIKYEISNFWNIIVREYSKGGKNYIRVKRKEFKQTNRRNELKKLE